MFSFANPDPPILERNIIWGDAEEKYPDKFMIVINARFVDSELHGDIIAMLTPEEYSELDFPEPMATTENLTLSHSEVRWVHIQDQILFGQGNL